MLSWHLGGIIVRCGIFEGLILQQNCEQTLRYLPPDIPHNSAWGNVWYFFSQEKYLETEGMFRGIVWGECLDPHAGLQVSNCSGCNLGHPG